MQVKVILSYSHHFRHTRRREWGCCGGMLIRVLTWRKGTPCSCSALSVSVLLLLLQAAAFFVTPLL